MTAKFRTSCLGVLLLLALALAASPSSTHAGDPQPPRIPGIADTDGDKIFDDLEGRLAQAASDQPFPAIVLLNEPLSVAALDSLQRSVGSFAVGHQYASIDGFAATLTKRQITVLAGLASVRQVEADRIVRPALDQASLWFGVQKARTDFGVDGNADGLSTYSANDMVVAVLDTGINAAHVDLDFGKVIAFVDCINGLPQQCSSVTPYDEGAGCLYHGTHVSSIAAGEGQGNAAYKGVAPGAALVSVKVLGLQDVGPPPATACVGTTGQVNAGIQWVITNRAMFGIEVMNMSLGDTGCSNGLDSQSLLVNQAVAAGIVAVVAAGNDGPATCTISSPGAAADAITVAAMADVAPGASGAGSCGPLPAGGFYLACFSSRGPTFGGPTTGSGVKPDISAPGFSIHAAAGSTPSGYVDLSGTSMATPFTAGAAALILQANPSLTPALVKSTIMNTAVDWGPPGKDIDYGSGRLDAYAAIDSVSAAAGTNITVPNHQFLQDSLAAFGQPGDSDTYAIAITNTAQPIAMTLIMTDWDIIPTLDFDAELLDKNGLLVASSLTDSRQETLSLLSPSNGPYRLIVYAWEGSQAPPDPPSPGGSYFLDVSVGGSIGLDSDIDTVPDTIDNCPTIANANQANVVHPATPAGDACDDPDADGVFDVSDNCPTLANSGQENTDGDAYGNACDNCPTVSNGNQANVVHPATPAGDACEDFDSDGAFDISDPCPDNPDCDGDTFLDGADNCPTIVNDQTNTDMANQTAGFRLGSGNPPPIIAGDLQGDVCDSDDDNDGFADPAEQRIYGVTAGSVQERTPCRHDAATIIDPWPVDFRPYAAGVPDPNRIVDTAEVSFILGFVGKSPASPGYLVRIDLKTDNPNDPGTAGVIDTGEVSLILGFVGLVCASP